MSGSMHRGQELRGDVATDPAQIWVDANASERFKQRLRDQLEQSGWRTQVFEECERIIRTAEENESLVSTQEAHAHALGAMTLASLFEAVLPMALEQTPLEVIELVRNLAAQQEFQPLSPRPSTVKDDCLSLASVPEQGMPNDLPNAVDEDDRATS
ncbi:hypothetical protein FVE85_4307 [Porphyridium purpureum]|uniref:Uncharacterized protein n=1 Tax=Porphyridium purpureum TaxID=35688 RepID=A0A5J4YU20_PORPP|nr:hypothetical protein FVE85_4307 [Porphyridium purpureum]|eukprot:POR6227..scf229_5